MMFEHRAPWGDRLDENGAADYAPGDGSDGFLVMDERGQPLFADPACAEIFGYSAPEILEWGSIAPLFGPDEAGLLPALLQAPSDSDATEPGAVLQGRHKNGARLWLEVRSSPVDWQGRPARRLAFDDIIRQRRAEKSRRRFIDALEHAAQGFTLWDAQDRLVYCNQYHRDLLDDAADALIIGATFETVLGDLVGRGVFPEAAGREQAFIEERLARHRGGSGAFDQRRNDRWIRVREERLADGSKLLTNTDITEQVEADRALRAMEARFSAVLDNTTAVIYLKDADGRYMLANRRARELCGGGDIVGQTDRELGAGEAADSWAANDRKVLETGEPGEFEERLVLPDGSTRTYVSTKFPLFDEQGAVSAIGGVSNDITFRQSAEQARRQSEERFRSLIDGSIQGVLIHDDPTVIYANAAAAEMFGHSADDMVGMDVNDLVWPDDRTRLRRYREERVAGQGAPSRYQFRGIKRDGAPVWLEQIVRVVDWDGRPVYQNTLIDVSMRKRHEEWRRKMTTRLVREKARAESANEAKSTFLASVSHELRTPLNTIIGFSDIMAQSLCDELSERYQGYIGDINASATQLLELIDDLLDLSKIEAGRTELFEERIDLAQLTEAVERIIFPRARAKGVRLTRKMPELGAELHADKRAVKQILLNLLTNAVKFTPPDGEVHLTARRSRGGLTLEVRDTGIGIPADELRHVFEPFRQGGGERRPDGTGLGLALVKELAALHDAEVRILSKPGAGTRALVEFPADRMLTEAADDR